MIRADLNEACLPPPRFVIDAVRDIDGAALSQYPSELYEEARAALTHRLRVEPADIILGSGADEAITLIMRARLSAGDNVVVLRPTFGMYARVAKSLDAQMRAVPYLERWRPNAEDIVAACDARTKLIFLGNPNNPTGEALEREVLRTVAERCPQAVVVVDEVYVGLTSRSLFDYARTLKNVAVIGSLSKVAALAGIRFGYAVCPPAITARMREIEAPFPISGPSLLAALAFLRGGAATAEFQSRLEAQTARSLQIIASAVGPFATSVWRSDANFVLMEFAIDAGKIAESLSDEGVAVRTFDDPLLWNCVRICALDDEETQRLVDAFRKISSRLRSGMVRQTRHDTREKAYAP